MKDIKTSGVSCKDAVKVVKRRFPSFDKSLLSKATKPEKYGIVLHQLSERLLIEAFPVLKDDAPQEAIPAPTARKNDYHKLTRKVFCRVTDAEGDLLQQRLAADGLTIQAFFTMIIRKYNNGEIPRDWL